MIAPATTQPLTTSPANGATSPAGPPPLWGGMRIPIILLSGEINSGKSLFPILIDPTCRDLGHEPNVCVWDQEGSVESYTGGINFEWKDTRAAIMDGFHLRTIKPEPNDPKWRRIILEKADANDYPSTALFRAWYMSLLATPRGKFRVGCVDTFTPIQEGMIEWLKTHPEAFGRTANQYDKASSMFLWPDVKAILSHILSVDCRLRFETFCLTVHLKNEWKGGSNTGIRIAEGLDVLDKLATLHLRLDRTAKSKLKSAPRLPFAIVKKQRLVKFGQDEDRPILPPRIPECTPDTIRAYIANPPDFANLKPEERMPDDAMSDDDKLRMQLAVSENNRVTSEAELTRLDKFAIAARAVSAQREAQQQVATTATGPVLASEQIVAELRGLINDAFASEQDAMAIVPQLLGAYGVQRVAELNQSQAEQIRIALMQRKSAEQQRRAAAKLAASGTEPTGSREPNEPTAAGAVGPAAISTERIEQIRAALPSAYATPEACQAGFAALLATFSVQKIADLNEQQGAVVFESLQQLASTRDQSAPANPTGPAGTNGTDIVASREKLQQLKDTCDKTGFTYERQAEWLQARGMGSFRSCTDHQIDELLEVLAKIPF